MRDAVLGMADGLTVPFALAAGLSGAAAASNIIVTAGVAEICAGAIAMGLGGYLAARSEIDHYASEFKREWSEVREKPHVEEREIEEIFESYGLSKLEIAPMVQALKRQPDKWVDFMMRFELGLERPNPRRALRSALTIGGAYVVGGLIPLSPYMVVAESSSALSISMALTFVALLVFGFYKGKFTGTSRRKSAFQTFFVGALAGAAAFYIAKFSLHI